MNPMKNKERQDTYHYGQNLSDRRGQILTHSFTFTGNKPLFPKSRHLSFKCHEDNIRVRALFSLPSGVFFYSPHFILQDKFSLWNKSSHFCWLVREDPEPTLLQTHTIMAHIHVGIPTHILLLTQQMLLTWVTIPATHLRLWKTLKSLLLSLMIFMEFPFSFLLLLLKS